MRFDRIQAKWQSREIMASSHPHPCLVTLVYLLVTTGVSLLVSFAVTNPMTAINQYLVDWANSGGGSISMEEVVAAAFYGSGGVLAFFSSVLLTLYQMVMQISYLSYAIRLRRRENAGYGNLLDGFGIAGKAIGLNLLIMLYTFLWMLPATVVMTLVLVAASFAGEALFILIYILCIIGAVVYAVWVQLRYAMVYYLLADHPEAGVLATVRSSVQTMKYWKMDYFVLQLTFLGWYLLSAVTMGLVGIWVTPYTTLTNIQFYEFISGRQAPQGNDGGF